jgi:hypothetical protein
MSSLAQAPNRVRSTGTAGVSSKAVTLQPVLAGSLILVCGAVWRATDPGPITVADDLGTTYTVHQTGTIAWSSGFSRGFIAYGRVSSAGTPTITVTPSGSSSFITFYAAEVGGTNVSPLETDGGESTGTGTSPSDGITTGIPDTVIVGLMQCASPASPTNITPASGLEELAEDESNLNAPFSAVWRRAPTAGAYTIDWTLGTSREWRVLTVSFKPLRDLVGAPTLALVTAGQMSLLAPEPHNVPLVLATRAQAGPHATPVSLGLQAAGLLTFAEARGHIALAINQTVPASLTPTAAHADSLALVLRASADTGIQANVNLALATSGSVAVRGNAGLALVAAGEMSFAASISGNAPLALAASGVLDKAPSANAGLVLATSAQLQVAATAAAAQLVLQVVGNLRQGIKGSVAFALVASGNIPRDVTGSAALRLAVSGDANAGNTALGHVALALSVFAIPGLASNPEMARLGSLATLHPSIAGQPGGTSYE